MSILLALLFSVDLPVRRLQFCSAGNFLILFSLLLLQPRRILVEAAGEAIDDAVRLGRTVSGNAGTGEPAFSVVEVINRSRKGDSAKVCELAQNGELLKNAPAVKGGFFKVTNIIE